MMTEEIRKGRWIKLPLFAMSLMLLAVGLLWQNGVVDPFGWIQLLKPAAENRVNPPEKEKKHPSAEKRVNIPVRKAAPVTKKITKEPGHPKPVVITKVPTAETAKKKPVVTSMASPFQPPSELKKAAEPVKILPQMTKKPSEGSVPKKPAVLAGIPKSETQQKKTTPVPEASTIDPPAYPYSLYIGSFKTLRRADKAVSIYTRKGLRPAYQVKVYLSNGEWYRVFVGYFTSREAADKFRRENDLPELEIKETPYANLIGTYFSTSELEDKIQSLRKLGFFPYVITDHGGKYRLYAGAFYPLERAERLAKELESKGIPSQIVKR